tara:strand:- start:967 stop:1119 length:153 start_codon:yes stop_codon:yes gene_type:complete
MKVNYIEEMVTVDVKEFNINEFEIEEEYVVGYYHGEYVEILKEDYLKLKK